MSERCDNPAMFRYTWPGKAEEFVCLIHAMDVLNLAKAMGLPLQIIRLEEDEMAMYTCSQVVEGGEE